MGVPETTIVLARPVYPMGKWKKPGGGDSSFRMARPAFLTWSRLQEKSDFALVPRLYAVHGGQVGVVPVKPGTVTGRCSVTAVMSSVLEGGREPVPSCRMDWRVWRTAR